MGHASFLQIREAIASGNVSPEKAVERLTKVIEAEYAKSNPDTDFIIACEDLLWELEHPGQPFVSQTERFRAFVAAQPCPTRTARASRWIVAAAAVLALCLGIGGFRYAWFSHSSSDDGQQYVIQGHEVTVEMISSAIAEHKDVSSFQTESWEEFIDFLGFVPSVPNAEALGMEVTQYMATIESDIISYHVHYHSNEYSALYSQRSYTNPDNAYLLFEQDASGAKTNIASSTVYTSSNIDKFSFLWLTENSVCRFSSDLPIDTGYKVVEALIEGD